MRYRGRGRPRSLPSLQAATVEQVQKSRLGQTRAPLDSCLMAGLLDANAHWSGMRLRYIHAAIHGVGKAQSGFYWIEQSARQCIGDDQLQQLAQEYRDAAQHLQQEALLEATLKLVQADEPSRCLSSILLPAIRGCELLSALWCKKAM